jgi:beta-glucanase (GH16 family)
LSLQFETYNSAAPGTSFLGSEIITKQRFAIEDGGVAFEARVRFSLPAAGVVAGFFAFQFDENTNRHSAIEFVLLGNDAVAKRHRVVTNVYSDEAFGMGSPAFVSVDDTSQFHAYRIEWLRDRVRWLVDSQLMREDRLRVPQQPMELHLNIWAPGADWNEAYSSELRLASDRKFNQSYFVEVDYVEIDRIRVRLI